MGAPASAGGSHTRILWCMTVLSSLLEAQSPLIIRYDRYASRAAAQQHPRGSLRQSMMNDSSNSPVSVTVTGHKAYRGMLPGRWQGPGCAPGTDVGLWCDIVGGVSASSSIYLTVICSGKRGHLWALRTRACLQRTRSRPRRAALSA